MNAEKCRGAGNVCCGTGHVCRDCDCAKLWARCDQNKGWITIIGVTLKLVRGTAMEDIGLNLKLKIIKSHLDDQLQILAWIK